MKDRNPGVLPIVAAASLLLSAASGEDGKVSLPDVPPAERPHVLLLGDSISMGYTGPVQELLKGKATVSRPPCNCADSGTGARTVQAWLGTQAWDVIHFNFGIWDTHWLKNGRIVSPPGCADKDTRRRFTTEQHIENMRTIVALLKQTGATLIWASTTPYVSYGEDTKRLLEANNQADKALMETEGVRVNDLYGLALPNLHTWQSKDGCHFTAEGYAQLAKQVASTLSDVLTQKSGETEPHSQHE